MFFFSTTLQFFINGAHPGVDSVLKTNTVIHVLCTRNAIATTEQKIKHVGHRIEQGM
jgi:hypothetical protein